MPQQHELTITRVSPTGATPSPLAISFSSASHGKKDEPVIKSTMDFFGNGGIVGRKQFTERRSSPTRTSPLINSGLRVPRRVQTMGF